MSKKMYQYYHLNNDLEVLRSEHLSAIRASKVWKLTRIIISMEIIAMLALLAV